ncbi:MAG: glycosyltransferase, partial [Pseudomonadota bacterium]
SRDAWAAARSAGPDLIVYHPKVLAAPHIGEALGIPVVMGLLQPMIVPTSEFPPVGLPRLAIPGYNRFGYSLVKYSYSAFRKSVNRVRTGLLGLKPVQSGRDVLLPRNVGPIKILHAISPAVVPRPADWPPDAIMTGYWYLPPVENYEPPANLARFLDAGPAPVYVGFGSMTIQEPASLLRMVIDALRTAGVRGVVASGWAGFDAVDTDDVVMIPAVPHGWLFPRMSAVVHHGGAGTMAQGLRAGVPCVVCPFFGDQPGWAERSVALGVGAQPVPRRKLSAERLAHSICSAIGDPSLRENANALAQVLQNEDGVAMAVKEIEESVHS